MVTEVSPGLRFGLVLSRPVSYLFFLIYLLQTAVLVYFVYEYYQNQQVIVAQQQKISELEDKLQILKIIEDFQIGFNDREVGELTHTIQSESRKYGYDPRFLISVILTESQMRKGRVSFEGAHGLMQIKTATGHELADRKGIPWRGENSLFDPNYNIKLGSFYLFDLILKFGDVKKALAAYNMGEYAVRDRLLENRPLPSQYARKVMERYQELLEKYPHSHEQPSQI